MTVAACIFAVVGITAVAASTAVAGTTAFDGVSAVLDYMESLPTLNQIILYKVKLIPLILNIS